MKREPMLLTDAQVDAVILAAANAQGGTTEAHLEKMLEAFETAAITMKLLELAAKGQLALRWSEEHGDIQAIGLEKAA